MKRDYFINYSRLLGLLLAIMAVLFSVVPANAQGTIRGRVTATSDSEPLPGVSVKVKGAATGTITDVNGSYAIKANDGDVLVFSFIGFKEKQVTVRGSNAVNVQLDAGVSALEEVVVIGYGVQRKKLTTGANLSVKGEDVQKQSTTSALQALQGQTPGAVITTTSGQPGSGINVVIRGRGTISNPNPLYVIDGLLGADINNINPADIESIDVLKDAASAAIYGAQAANGVILVTTRTGKQGQRSRVTVDAYSGLQQTATKARLLNSQEYAVIYNESLINSGKAPYFSNSDIAGLGTGTNWLDQMFVDDAPTQNYVLGAQGSNAGSVYSVSLSYTDQAGIVGGADYSNYKRYGFRINSEHNLYKGILKVGQHLNFISRQNNGIQIGNIYSNTLRGAFATSPLLKMYDDAGNFINTAEAGSWNSSESNPFAAMVYNNQNRNNEQNVFGDLYAILEPIKNLTFRTSLNLNFNSSDYRSFRPVYVLSNFDRNDNTQITQSMFKGRNLQFDNQLSYQLNLSKPHKLDLMAGSSVISYKNSNVRGVNINAAFNDLDHAYLNNSNNPTNISAITLQGKPEENKQLSFFGRAQYDFKETYLLNATFRADASSRFAKGHRWGYFPSVSAGWILSNESFFKGLSNAVDFFKLRASWGQVGNQNISNNQYNAPIEFRFAAYNFGAEGANTGGAYPSRLGNEDIKWETSEQINIGFDARVLHSKLNLNLDYYVKNTKDWLLVPTALATFGTAPPYSNGGDVKNSGVELGLTYLNNIGKFNYSIGVNGSYNKNKIGNIPTANGIINGPGVAFDNSTEFYRAANGMPVGFFIGYKTNGIFQTAEEVKAYKSAKGAVIQPDAAAGDVRFADLDGDGVIGNGDRTMIGDPNPDYTFGLNLSANFKGFDLSVLSSGVAGNQIFQAWRKPGDSKANWSAAILNRWHGAGTSNTMPRVTEDNRNWAKISDLYIHDGDYFRINNITLGYDLSKVIKKSYLGRLRLYASALNVYTFTRYNGLDPEIGYGESNTTQNFASGVDFGYYPRPRTFLLGANVTF